MHNLADKVTANSNDQIDLNNVTATNTEISSTTEPEVRTSSFDKSSNEIVTIIISFMIIIVAINLFLRFRVLTFSEYKKRYPDLVFPNGSIRCRYCLCTGAFISIRYSAAICKSCGKQLYRVSLF